MCLIGFGFHQYNAFEFKKFYFCRFSAWCGEAANLAVSADNAVAGDNKGKGILGEGVADSPGGVGLS